MSTAQALTPGMLLVSSFAHTSCAQSADRMSAVANGAALSVPGANLETGSALRTLSVPSGSNLRIDVGLAFAEAFGRVSDGGASELVLPWETPLMKAIFSEDPGASVCLNNKPPVMVGSVPSLPVPVQQTKGVRISASPGELGVSCAAQALQPLRDEDVLRKQQRMIEQGVAKWRLVFGRYARDFGEMRTAFWPPWVLALRTPSLSV